MTRALFLGARSSMMVACAMALFSCQRGPLPGDTSVTLQLALESGDVKGVTISLGEGPTEIIGRLQPASFAADDDPLLMYGAADGGHYVLYFSTSGTEERNQLFDDKLYGVARFGPDAKDGAFPLPAPLRGQSCPEKYLGAKEILERAEDLGESRIR